MLPSKIKMSILAIKDDLSSDILIYEDVHVKTHIYILGMYLD